MMMLQFSSKKLLSSYYLLELSVSCGLLTVLLSHPVPRGPQR